MVKFSNDPAMIKKEMDTLSDISQRLRDANRKNPEKNIKLSPILQYTKVLEVGIYDVKTKTSHAFDEKYEELTK